MYSVVRQAMMQNQDPEIQAKLVAMQRQMAPDIPQLLQQISKPAAVKIKAPDGLSMVR